MYLARTVAPGECLYCIEFSMSPVVNTVPVVALAAQCERPWLVCVASFRTFVSAGANQFACSWKEWQWDG
jgi:hypothetical protein